MIHDFALRIANKYKRTTPAFSKGTPLVFLKKTGSTLYIVNKYKMPLVVTLLFNSRGNAPVVRSYHGGKTVQTAGNEVLLKNFNQNPQYISKQMDNNDHNMIWGRRKTAAVLHSRLKESFKNTRLMQTVINEARAYSVRTLLNAAAAVPAAKRIKLFSLNFEGMIDAGSRYPTLTALKITALSAKKYTAAHPEKGLAVNRPQKSIDRMTGTDMQHAHPAAQGVSKRSGNALKKEEDIHIDISRNIPAQRSSNVSSNVPQVDIRQLSEQVYKVIEKKLKMERERKGF